MSIQSNLGIWVAPEKFKSYQYLSPWGVATVKDTRRGNVVGVYVHDAQGNYVIEGLETSAPGDTPQLTLNRFYDGSRDVIGDFLDTGENFTAQVVLTPCGGVDNPAGYLNQGMVWHYVDVTVLDRTLAVKELKAAGTMLEQPYLCQALAVVDYRPMKGNSMSYPAGALSLSSVSGYRNSKCSVGTYPGQDKILFAPATATVAIADVFFSVDGGVLFTPMTNKPFLITESCGDSAVFPVGVGGVTVVANAGTVTGASIAYASYPDFNTSTILGATWVTVGLTATANEIVTQLYWNEYSSLYAGTSLGNIYVSADAGITWTLVGALGQQVNSFTKDNLGNVFAFCSGNVVGIEFSNSKGSFLSRVGPTGGVAFGAAVASRDGYIYAGNGNVLYRSNDRCKTVGGWSVVKTLVATETITGLFLEGLHRFPRKGGVPELLRLVATDTTNTTGNFYSSKDGGTTWNTVAFITNTGYTDTYWNSIGNGSIVAGVSTLIKYE